MKPFIFYTVLLLLTLNCAAAGKQGTDINKETGAKTWHISEHGVYFSLTQLLPEQLRAFYVNRGFTLQQIEDYAQSCVYMAVLRNDSAAGNVHFVSNLWTADINGQSHALQTVQQWIDRLSTESTSKASLIAFRWAQFPPEQEYQPGGDWNQGMLSIGLPPGRQFDFNVQWDINGTVFNAQLKGVECAQ
jgi:hypothetical protein